MSELESFDDEELGRMVRETPAFRAAVACGDFADSAQEIRDNDSVAFDRLIDGTLDRCSRVRSEDSVRDVVEAFLDEIENHASLGENADDFAETAVEDALDE